MSSYFSPTDKNSPAMHAEFMGFTHDEEAQGVLRGWIKRQGFPESTIVAGGADLFGHMLENAPPPKRAVVDIDETIKNGGDPAEAAVRLVSLCGADCRLIVIGSANDVGLYRKMMAAGVVDYLVKPLTTDLINQALLNALKGGSGGKPVVKEARIIVFIGTRGGVGATTIAVNTGWLMAHEFTKQVALLDLDLQFGTSALALDLEPGRGLRDIVSSPHRVDGLMIASSMVNESDQFSVLGAEEAVDEAVLVDGAAIEALLKEMRGNFDFILIDLPRHSFHEQKRLLATAHEVVLVTELSLAGIRDTLRLKTGLRAVDSTAALTVIASRAGNGKAGQVDATAFEKGAQIKIDFTLPEDLKTVALAANSGKSIGAVAKQAPIAKILLDITTRLSGPLADTNRKPQNLLGRLLGSGKKKP